MKKVYTLFAFALIIWNAQAQTSTGFTSPSATTAPNGWTNPTNAFVSDDVYTTVIHQSGCRCPFLYLSWNNSLNFTSSQLVGPYGTVDGTDIAGSSSDLWGHAWVDSEFSDTSFVLKIANPSTLILQGYKNFGFNIPTGSTIDGIEVLVEEHGDAGFTMEFIDLIQVNVHYTSLTTGMSGIASPGRKIIAYPNPVSSLLTVESFSDEIISLTIFDLAGRKMTEQNYSHAAKVQIDVSDFPAGMYFLSVNYHDEKERKMKIVKQ